MGLAWLYTCTYHMKYDLLHPQNHTILIARHRPTYFHWLTCLGRGYLNARAVLVGGSRRSVPDRYVRRVSEGERGWTGPTRLVILHMEVCGINKIITSTLFLTSSWTSTWTTRGLTVCTDWLWSSTRVRSWETVHAVSVHTTLAHSWLCILYNYILANTQLYFTVLYIREITIHTCTFQN